MTRAEEKMTRAEEILNQVDEIGMGKAGRSEYKAHKKIARKQIQDLKDPKLRAFLQSDPENIISDYDFKILKRGVRKDLRAKKRQLKAQHATAKELKKHYKEVKT